MTAKRLAYGGRIDRSNSISLTFEGRNIPAFAGDTFASALLAADQTLIGRSFKYHRPRGILTAGVEEPNALVELGQRAYLEPNTPVTTIEAALNLTAAAQNAWPSLRFDIGAANGMLSRFLGAGFYYKTFIGPFYGTRFWMLCEGFIRRAAGMGRATTETDPDHYEKINAYCDRLIIGGGPAGLAAALAAGNAGESVILVEQDFTLGGGLLSNAATGPGADWLRDIESQLEALPNIRILRRTTGFGAYDGNVWGLVERIPPTAAALPRQRYWLVRTKAATLATGALERPLVFAGNDKPGVMMAGAVRQYLNRYAVLCGQTIVICTNNDSAHALARDLARAGATVSLCDMRQTLPDDISRPTVDAGVTLRVGYGVVGAKGAGRVKSALIAKIDANGQAVDPAQSHPCDLIAMSGGWTPTLHLWSQRYGKPVFRTDLDAFIPDAARSPDITCVGAIIGTAETADCIAQAGGKFAVSEHPTAWPRDLLAVHVLTHQDGSTKGKAFVDFQHDVKLADIDQAHAEGYVSVEHLKRYTTSGMAADQGKTSNLNAMARMAMLRGLDVPSVGSTTFRPPYTPVSIGALVGHDHGPHFTPTRRSPIHHWHVEHGAKMTEAGAWMRPWYYPQSGENLRAAYIREAAHVRDKVGIVDVSTLGKIAVQGPDAAEFLNRTYANDFKTLAPGRLRYGVMLRDDGMVMDDGATACLGDGDYFMSTTTANAAKVLARAELLLQTDWCDLRCHVTTVTDQWAAIAIAGPNARAVLQAVSTGADLSPEALPNNHFTQITINATPCRLHRMSYSGELAYEIYIPARHGRAVWQVLINQGGAHGLQPYGTEAMGALRIEKGHVAGAEIEGRTAINDLGLASSKKPFIGSVLRNRPVLISAARPSLVGLRMQGETAAKPGALLFAKDTEAKGHGQGWVSSTTYSPALGCNIALAMLANGADRIGETIRVVSPVDRLDVLAEVCSSHFFDPKGVRQNA
jgi:heterotetrameric sarcosine oxidase alpha subunit